MTTNKEGNFFSDIFRQRAVSVKQSTQEEEKAAREKELNEKIISEKLDRRKTRVVEKFGVSKENLEQAGLKLLPHVLQIGYIKGGMEFLFCAPVNEELGRIEVLSEVGKGSLGINRSESVSVEFLKSKNIWWGCAGYESSGHCYRVSLQTPNGSITCEVELGDFWRVPEPAFGGRQPIISSKGRVIGKFGEDKGSASFIFTKWLELEKGDIIINVAGISETSNFKDFNLNYGDALTRVVNVLRP